MIVYRLMAEGRGDFPRREARLQREENALAVYYQGKEYQIREEVADLTAGIRRCLQWLEGYSHVREQLLDREETERQVGAHSSTTEISPLFHLLRPGEVKLVLEQKEIPGVLSAVESKQLFDSLPVVLITNVMSTDSKGLWYCVEYQGQYLGNSQDQTLLAPGSFVRLLPRGKAQLVRRPVNPGRCTSRAGIFQRSSSRVTYTELVEGLHARGYTWVKPEPAEGEVFDWMCSLDFKFEEPASAAGLSKRLAPRMRGGSGFGFSPELGEVVKHNYSLQQEARQWNLRAGENAFPVFSELQWQDWIISRLAGATSPETITNMNMAALRLPALDPEVMEIVRMINPPSIQLLGTERSVEYGKDRDGQPLPPTITLEGADMEVPAFEWKNIPDEGVRLPGTDRMINIRVKIVGTSFAGSDIPSLKKKVTDHLNFRQWYEWRERPAIAVPNLGNPLAEISEITAFQYGTCVVTGTPLFAYGTVRVNPRYRRDRDDEVLFEAAWLQSKAEAEKANAEAQAELAKIKTEFARKTARIPAEQVREEAKMLLDSIPFDLRDLRESVGKFAYELPYSAEELVEWTASARRQLGQAKFILAATQAEEPIVEAILERLGHRGNRGIARTAIEFGKQALRVTGSRQQAIEIISHETAPPGYGFSRRQEAIRNNLPGIEKTGPGAYILSPGTKLESGFNPILRGALVWLERQEESAPKVIKEENSPAELDDPLAALRNKWGAK